MSDSKINQSGGYTTPMLPTDFDGWNIMSHTEIGKRSNQEDRFTYHPQLLNGEYAFFGVFDGTVKEYASEWIHMHILPIFLKSASFTKFHALSTAQKREPDNQALLANALSETYATADQMLIRWCADRQIHYSACTSVTIIIHRPTSAMYVAHVGDSHCVLGTFKKSSKGKQISDNGVLSLVLNVYLRLFHSFICLCVQVVMSYKWRGALYHS